MKLLLTFLLLSIHVLAQAEGIQVEAMGGGESTLTHSGKAQSLRLNDSLVASDKIQVGKKTAVDLRLQDNTLVRVGSDTTLEIRDKSLHLLSGSVRVLVPEQKANHKSTAIRFHLSTPEGSVGVRGTEFITDRLNSATTVHTLRGEVLFGPSADFSNLAKFAVVMKGFESTLKLGESKASAPKKFSIDSYLPSATLQSFSSLATREAGMQQARSKVAEAKEEATNTQKPTNTASKASTAKTSSDDTSASQSNANELLLSAAAKGDVVQMQSAMLAGADPNKAVMPGTGDTILHVAAVSEHLEAVQYILDYVHVPVDYPNLNGQTALMESASEAASQDIVLLLLQNKASRVAKDKAGRTALDYAKGNPNNKTILSLLQSYSQ